MRGSLAAAALLLAAPAAAAQEAEPAIPPEHRAQADRAQEMVDRLEAGDKRGSALKAARALLDECLAAGNHRSAEFLAGHVVAAFPDQLRDHHRFVEILLARGKLDRAESDLRELVKESPTDCEAYILLYDLLIERGRPGDAMEVQAHHLREHVDEAGPLSARASIALWNLHDPAAALAAAAEMRSVAERRGGGSESGSWLLARAAEIEKGAATNRKDREILGAASSRLDGVLWATFLGAALALATAGWLTRRKD